MDAPTTSPTREAGTFGEFRRPPIYKLMLRESFLFHKTVDIDECSDAVSHAPCVRGSLCLYLP